MNATHTPNLEFSVPYNDELETLEEIFTLKKTNNNTIREVYLSGPQEYSGSGRVMDEMDLDRFLQVVDRIHGQGLKVNLVVNSTCQGSGWYSPDSLDKLLGYLEQVHEEHGVEAITIANPLLIQAVRSRFPRLVICASVLADIDCVQRAVIFKEAGADVITPDVTINRNLEVLKDIQRIAQVEIKLMVNEGCLFKCPYRKFHFNYVSHVSHEAGNEEGHFLPHCHAVIDGDPSQILKSGWIRPEDMSKYHEVTNYFKIVGRALPKSKCVRVVRAYLEESWDGDLLDIICSSLGSYAIANGTYLDNKTLGEYGFFERVTACGQNCSRCNYCKQLADELISVIGFTEEKIADKGLDDIIDSLQVEGVFEEGAD